MSAADAARSRRDRLTDLFAAIDGKDADRFVEFLTPDGSFRFGSAPKVEGREAVRAAVAGFFDSIRGLSHEINAVFGSGDTLFCEGETTYTRHDGSTVTVPFADVFEYDGELIAEYKIYADIGPLYA